jgi:hypothetical protein
MQMTEADFLKVIEQGKKEGKEFIKWWRKENDFVDFELIDRYLQTEDARHDFENFDLLDIEEMWEILKEQVPGELYHRVATKSDTIEWQRIGKDGEKHTYVCHLMPTRLCRFSMQKPKGIHYSKFMII